jgi:hypothetical protein
MADKEKMWTPSEKQEAPKKTAKKAPKKVTKSTEPKVNQDGNVAGQRVTFEQIQQGMKKQSHPVIETSKRRRKKS